MKMLERDVEAGSEDKLFNRSSLPQGVSGEPAKLNPVSWDKLPTVSPAGRTRLATPAPGTEKGSGLVDISGLLAKHKEEQAAKKPAAAAPKAPPPAPRARQASEPRLATAAKAGGGSGLIELDAIRDAVKQAESAKQQTRNPVSSTDDDAIPSFATPDVLTSTPSDRLVLDDPAANSSQRMMLLGAVGLLVVVLALLGYVAST